MGKAGPRPKSAQKDIFELISLWERFVHLRLTMIDPSFVVALHRRHRRRRPHVGLRQRGLRRRRVRRVGPQQQHQDEGRGRDNRQESFCLSVSLRRATFDFGSRA